MTRRAVQVVIAALALQAALVALFVVPVRTPEPHGLPVGVAGPPPAVAAAERALGPEVEVHRYATAAEARTAIREREVYGALVPAERRVLVASAASPAVAQMLGQHAGPGAQVEDVVPLADGDPRGATLNALFLPLMIAAFPLAALLVRLRVRPAAVLGAVTAFAVLGGLLLTALVGPAMDAVPGPYLAVSAVVALIVAAVALPAAALMRVLGPPGLAVAAALFVLIGNPGSGNASAPELLPGFWRVTGQLLPPGAGGQALRGAAYFDGHALAQPALVLGAWALLGAALLLAGRRAREKRALVAAPPRVAVSA